MGELKDELREIKELLREREEPKKQKKFKMPRKGKVSPKKASKGFVTIMKINENGYIDFSKEQIKEQTVMVDGVPRLTTPEYVLHWKKNPVVILPSWSVKPYSPEEQHDKSLIDGSNTRGYQILMAKMKSETISAKKSMGGALKWIIGIGLAALIGYALITGGKG